ncbi:hypothetical protein SAMN05421839_1431, partial [Halolactibacillus halophilus]
MLRWHQKAAQRLIGCIIFGVGEGILSETEIAHLNNSLAPYFCLNV